MIRKRERRVREWESSEQGEKSSVLQGLMCFIDVFYCCTPYCCCLFILLYFYFLSLSKSILLISLSIIHNWLYIHTSALESSIAKYRKQKTDNASHPSTNHQPFEFTILRSSAWCRFIAAPSHSQSDGGKQGRVYRDRPSLAPSAWEIRDLPWWRFHRHSCHSRRSTELFASVVAAAWSPTDVRTDRQTDRQTAQTIMDGDT